ncbi:hypothetical protein PR202_ga18825 [Eleusine coracana subsp. coracana]|uniref:AB hydrolase-1 domain-containing protein n=1 Tax=Eleusine coracana subsp. coracana TaxID=191504 RepID=A0AAV5CU01_ELECO|nr:hypothetical protein PR202_ga18825 [Eleusine coracana subsp. coracana]
MRSDSIGRRNVALLPPPRATSSSSSSSVPLFLLPSVPAATSGSTSAFSPCSVALSPAASGRFRGGVRSRRRRVTVAASSKDGSGTAKEDEEPAFNPFGFVTDNPSSRGAIQLPAVPAEDGNVGQMLYRIEDKGREYGSYVRAGEFRWFVRETGSPDARRGTIVFIHGAPTSSFSYRMVMSQMADAGYHCFAPDWIGFGFSEMPQTGYGFDFKEEEFHKAFDDLIGTLNITEPFFLVVQGFLVGSYGLTWALKNSSKILKLAILNSPLTVSSPLPGVFQQLSWEKPILLAWGISDKYLPVSIAEEFKKGNPGVVKLEAIEGAGHMPQEDWPEKVVKALTYFRALLSDFILKGLRLVVALAAFFTAVSTACRTASLECSNQRMELAQKVKRVDG